LRPPMKNRAIIVSEDRTTPPDRYGNYPKIRQDSIARVKFSTSLVTDPDGSQRQASLEVDLPPEVNLQYGVEIEALDSNGVWHTAQIVAINDATNFAGNRILYRTVMCA
jgi:hypothetical protein